MQLRISERSGRGVSRIVDVYGENVFEITDDFVRVTIPFAYERYFGTQLVEQKTEQKTEQKNLTQPERIKQIIISEMKNNSSITTMQLMNITGLKKTSIQNYIRELTTNGIIERVGAKKGGFWKVNDNA